MHSTFRSTLKLAFVSVASATMLALPAPAETTAASAGSFDFGTFTRPTSGGEFVEVNLHDALLKFAARIAANDEPEVAKLIADLQAVHVRVIGIDDGNRDELTKRIAALHDDLTTRGWHKVVTAQQKRQNVGVFMKFGADETVEGIVVTAIDGGNEAVFVNVAGNIRPEQLLVLGERLGIDPLRRAAKAAGV
jgi:hypothetical protein